MEYIKPETMLERILSWVVEAGASDLHLQEQKPARYRVEGQLKVLSPALLPPLTRERLLALLEDNLSPAALTRIAQSCEVDLSLQMGETRWRANFSKQNNAAWAI